MEEGAMVVLLVIKVQGFFGLVDRLFGKKTAIFLCHGETSDDWINQIRKVGSADFRTYFAECQAATKRTINA